jgi:hypothetical protein
MALCKCAVAQTVDQIAVAAQRRLLRKRIQTTPNAC